MIIKTLRISLVMLFVFALLSIKTKSQTIITYDFNNRETLSGTIPFDRPFLFKFTNIGSQQEVVNSIVVKIYQVDISNYRKLIRKDKTQPKIVGNENILENSKLVIRPDSIIRNVNFVGNEAYMLNAVTLKPSSNYFIEIKTNIDRKLTETEKNEVSNALNNVDDINVELENIFNKFGRVNIIDPKTSYDTLYTLSQQLIDISKGILKKKNEQYTIRSLTTSEKVSNLEVFVKEFDYFTKIGKYLRNISGTKKNEPLDPTLVQQINSIDWANIDINELKVFFKTIPKNKDSNYSNFKDDSSKISTNIESLIRQKNVILNSILDKVIVSNVILQGTTGSTFPIEYVKQASQFITSDLGYAYVWGMDRTNPYIATQISLTPIDDSIPLKQYKGVGNFFRSRTTFLLGISIDGIAKANIRKGLIGNQALILGSGFKLWPWLKLNSGVYCYYKEPVNPVISQVRTTFTASPFISLSIDVRIQSLLNGVGNAIFKQTSTQNP